MSPLVRYVRLYVIQAWFAWRSLFGWSNPFSYITSKFGFSFFSMLMFIYLGRFVGLDDPVYIVIGNILLIPASNCLSGISMTVGNERAFGAMSYLLGSPAPRTAVFLGRGLFHILDSFLTVVVALLVATAIFDFRFSGMNFPLALLCVFITAFTTSGLGYLTGSITLVNRDGWMITSTLSLSLYILVGANFPVSSLPAWIQPVSYALPMTRGILAARAALAGAGWGDVAGLLAGEAAIGLAYIAIGYWMFRILERKSMVSGILDNV